MKSVIVLCFCAVVMGAPTSDRSLPAIEQTISIDELGQYKLYYVTAEGTIVSESGHFVPSADGKGRVLVYEGEFQYKGDDGRLYITKYTAGAEEGYKPVGDHLPIAPKVPDVPLPEPPKIIIPTAEPLVPVPIVSEPVEAKPIVSEPVEAKPIVSETVEAKPVVAETVAELVHSEP